MKSFKPSTGKKIAAFSFFMCMVVIGGMAVYYQYMKRQQLKSTTPDTHYRGAKTH